jgi:hypothetical protein
MHAYAISHPSLPRLQNLFLQTFASHLDLLISLCPKTLLSLLTWTHPITLQLFLVSKLFMWGF